MEKYKCSKNKEKYPKPKKELLKDFYSNPSSNFYKFIIVGKTVVIGKLEKIFKITKLSSIFSKGQLSSCIKKTKARETIISRDIDNKESTLSVISSRNEYNSDINIPKFNLTTSTFLDKTNDTSK